jgi:hypothetical protein
MIKALVGAAALIASGPLFADTVTAPIAVQQSGIFPTNGLSVIVGSDVAPDLESAVTAACGGDEQKYHVLSLDTHVVFQQPPAGGTASYSIQGTVTCEVYAQP